MTQQRFYKGEPEPEEVPKGLTPRIKRLLWITSLSIVIFVAVGLLWPNYAADHRAAVEAINQCPRAVELLGEGIEYAPLSLDNRVISQVGEHGGAIHARIKVEGPKGAGWYRYDAFKGEGAWRVIYGVLQHEERKLMVSPCVDRAQLKAMQLEGTRTLEGTITAARDKPKLRLGDACAVEIQPNPGFSYISIPDTALNCKLLISCGEVVLYGWGETGYNICELEAGRVRRVEDPMRSSADGDGAVLLDVAQGRLIVRDDPEGRAYEVEIALERAAPTSRP